MDDRRSAPDLTEVAGSFVDGDLDRAVKRGYLRWLPPSGRVVDVGCGAGAMLDVLKDAGIDALGIEVSAVAAARARERGHEVTVGEATSALRELAADGESFDGAVVAHVIEHLQPERVADLLLAVSAVLRAGARVVVVTPNVQNAIVLEETFWLDPTHVRPYPRALVERLCEAAGLRVVASLGDPATRPRRPAWRRWLAALRSRLSGCDRSGPMDMLVVAERP